MSNMPQKEKRRKEGGFGEGGLLRRMKHLSTTLVGKQQDNN